MKVAAGALGAGWPDSRWGELHAARAGLPASAAGGLLLRPGRGFAGPGTTERPCPQGRAGSSPLSGALPCRALGCRVDCPQL